MKKKGGFSAALFYFCARFLDEEQKVAIRKWNLSRSGNTSVTGRHTKNQEPNPKNQKAKVSGYQEVLDLGFWVFAGVSPTHN